MRRLKATEHDEQTTIVSWWDASCSGYGLPSIALIAIPNANKLLRLARNSHALAEYMRREGLRPGALDLLLAVPHKGKGGLWIENKIKPNKPSTEQIKMIDFLECGYEVKVCYNADEGIKAIKEYLQ